MNFSRRNIEILSVEDNEADRGLLQAEFSLCKTPHRLQFVCDGEEAMQYLLKKGNYAKSATPDLILLDLNLPLKSGIEVLSDIKKHPQLKQIPVIVLSTSCHPNDVSSVYSLGASSFISKPTDLDWFHYMVKSIESFWLVNTHLPQTQF